MPNLKIIKNPNEYSYNEATKAVNECDGYCPCMIERTEDTKCPCKEFREQETEGTCHCGRYMKVRDEE